MLKETPCNNGVLSFNNGFTIVFDYRHIELNKAFWITYPVSFRTCYGSGYTVNGICSVDYITVQKTQIGYRINGNDNGQYNLGYIICGF